MVLIQQRISANTYATCQPLVTKVYEIYNYNPKWNERNPNLINGMVRFSTIENLKPETWENDTRMETLF